MKILIPISTCKYCIYYNPETKGCIRNPSVEPWEEDDFCSYGKDYIHECYGIERN